MEKLIKKYFADEDFRMLTLKEALIQMKNINPSWFETKHLDFDQPLVDIMSTKVEQWHLAGIDTSQIEVSIIVKEFNKYKKLYKLTPPPVVKSLLEELETIKQYQLQLKEFPESPNALKAQKNIETITIYIKHKIDELS